MEPFWLGLKCFCLSLCGGSGWHGTGHTGLHRDSDQHCTTLQKDRAIFLSIFFAHYALKHFSWDDFSIRALIRLLQELLLPQRVTHFWVACLPQTHVDGTDWEEIAVFRSRIVLEQKPPSLTGTWTLLVAMHSKLLWSYLTYTSICFFYWGSDCTDDNVGITGILTHAYVNQSLNTCKNRLLHNSIHPVALWPIKIIHGCVEKCHAKRASVQQRWGNRV